MDVHPEIMNQLADLRREESLRRSQDACVIGGAGETRTAPPDGRPLSVRQLLWLVPRRRRALWRAALSGTLALAVCLVPAVAAPAASAHLIPLDKAEAAVARAAGAHGSPDGRNGSSPRSQPELSVTCRRLSAHVAECRVRRYFYRGDDVYAVCGARARVTLVGGSLQVSLTRRGPCVH